MDKTALDNKTVKDRLVAVASTFAEKSELRAFKPLIDKAFAIYLKRLDEEDVVNSLLMIRDELIPWLIYGSPSDTSNPSDEQHPTD